MITVGDLFKSQINELHRDNDGRKERTHHLLDDILALDPQHRPKALLKMMRHRDNDVNELWPIVGQIWCDTKSDEQSLSEWSKIWGMDGDRSLVMQKHERVHLTDLPEKFIVWQGGAFLEATHGLSWTDDMETAYSHALRVATVEKPAIVVWGELEKSKVLAFFNKKGKSEFVAVPAEVKILGYKPVRVRSIDHYSRWEIPSIDD
jgi:hypothetical protein